MQIDQINYQITHPIIQYIQQPQKFKLKPQKSAMKCTLTQTKQQKINSLQQQNKALTMRLQKLIEQSLSSSIDVKEIQKDFKCIQTQLEVQKMRRSLLLTSIMQLTNQQEKNQKDILQLRIEMERVQEDNRKVSGVLYDRVKRKEEMEAGLRRLKAELQQYKNIGSSHIMKSSENMKKKNQSLLRALNILTNKLNSHKKYLQILQKKQEKSQLQAQNIVQKIGTKTKSSTNIQKKQYLYQRNEKRENTNINCQGEDERKKQKELEKKKIKQLDQMIRKRNHVLSHQGSQN